MAEGNLAQFRSPNGEGLTKLNQSRTATAQRTVSIEASEDICGRSASRKYWIGVTVLDEASIGGCPDARFSENIVRSEAGQECKVGHLGTAH